MKQLEIISQQPKARENRIIVDIKPVFIKHPNTSHKLSKTIKQAKKVGSVKIRLLLYIVKQKTMQINAEILNFLNLEV